MPPNTEEADEDEEQLGINLDAMVVHNQRRGADAYDRRNRARRRQQRQEQERELARNEQFIEERIRLARDKTREDLLRLKNIRLEDKIGDGAYAEVYRGVRTSTGKTFAIKVIDLVRTSRRYRGEIDNEMEILRDMNHRRIIKVYSLLKLGRLVVVIMDFAANGSLSEYIMRKGKLRERATQALTKETLRGLAFMHSQHVAHRDVKLENILLTRGNIPKLADFSFSIYWDEDEDSLCRNFCGSLPYFSPELLAQRPYNPFAADIWALAVCIYVISNDSFPFSFEQPREMLAKQEARDWQLREPTRSEYSNEYKSLLLRMFHPNPRSRISTREVCVHPWIANNPR